MASIFVITEIIFAFYCKKNFFEVITFIASLGNEFLQFL